MTTDWRDEVGALERFRNVERIAELRSLSQQEAYTLENTAFAECASKEAYDAQCQALIPSQPPSPRSPPPSSTPGIQIGSFPNCTRIGSGITSTVYRSASSALKVIDSPTLPPHNAQREIHFLRTLAPTSAHLISLLSVFRDADQHLVLEFPYMPCSLSSLLAAHTTARTGLAAPLLRSLLRDIASALQSVHAHGVIHRDVKPSSILLASPTGPAYLADFSSSWHADINADEPPAGKILDIGTGPWRAPEALFGNKAYTSALDMWALGTLVVECARSPPRSLFTSPGMNEDGNQLGLILSIFKTLGTPTRETWPEAAAFKTPPFDIYAVFEGLPADEIYAGIEPEFREIAENLVVYESSKRWTADKLLQHLALKDDKLR
ncbi:hypothetical protein TD95_004566 [Thielaviopsis punctulata]|uniref:cyclin-dependent kinase n=1 Tax=Thielaviopsis punctulata TaxID=72032 RepID=A0A0F4ZJM6_9PEZI|nr:hypothetical protein TD95_004566 [Thielaviopsis punctulata]